MAQRPIGAGARRVESLAQVHDFRIVKVEPGQLGRRIDPVDTAVQAATEVEHLPLGMAAEEVAAGLVEVMRAHGQGPFVAFAEGDPGEVEVDLPHRLLGETVMEDGIVQAAIQRLGVEGDQERLLFR